MDLLKTITDSENAEAILGTYLNSCQEQLPFINQDASQEKSLITSINCKLNEPSTRFVGLSVLHTFLQSCPQNTLNENAISWLSLCLKGTNSPVASTCNLSYQVLSCLFHRCSDQAKHVASAVLPKLLEHLQSVPKHCMPAALGCLEACMTVYNGSCGHHKNSIQKFLIPLLEYNGPNKAAVVWKASVCIALVPQLGGGSVGGLTYQENWTKQLKIACSTLHEILDDLFSSVHELEVANVEVTRGEAFPFESLQDKDSIGKVYAMATRFEGVVNCIHAMLLGDFGVIKNLPPSAVLSVVCRGLAVSSVSLQSTSTTESLALLSVLPNLQTKLFELLRSLISCCGANLLPFGRLVIKLVLQTLKWTMIENWKHKTTKPYRSLRKAAYECMKHWLECVRTVPTCDDLAELVEISCGDFGSEDDGVRLISGKSKNKYANRKDAKKKRASNASTAEEDSAPLDPAANKDVCVAALRTVETLLAVHGWALNGGSYVILHDTTLKLVLSVSCQPQNPVVPYGEPEARVELYRLLWSLVSHPHPLIAAPVRMAWRLFSLGQNDPSLKVSSYCVEALSNMEKIVHPSFVPLVLPVPESDDDKDPVVQTSIDENLKPPAWKPVEKETSSKGKEPASKTERKESSFSELSEMKECEDTVDKDTGSNLSNGVDQEMIDVSDEAESGSNGADIEEVPVEINLVDSEESRDGEHSKGSRGVTDGIEIIDDTSIAVDDFRLVISPEPGSASVDTRGKRRAETISEDTKKSIVSNSRPVDGGDDPPPPKVIVVAEDDVESDVDAMLATFVDKVKPIYDDV